MAKKKHKRHDGVEVEIEIEVVEVVKRPFLPSLVIPGTPGPVPLPPSTAKNEIPLLAANPNAVRPLFPMPGDQAAKLVIPPTVIPSRPAMLVTKLPEPPSVSFKFQAKPGVRFSTNPDGSFEFRINTESVVDFYNWMRDQLDEQAERLAAAVKPKPKTLDVRVDASGEVKVTRKSA